MKYILILVSFVFTSTFVQSIYAQSSDAIIERKIMENLKNNLPAYAGMDAVHTFTITMDNSLSIEDLMYQEDKAKKLLTDSFPFSRLKIEKAQNGIGYIHITCDSSVEWEKIKKSLSEMGFEINDRDIEYVVRK
jgi:hypothetical protein